MKNARRKLVTAAMLCETPMCQSSRETCRNIGKHKTQYACIVEADESMRIRIEGAPRRYDEDHIAGKGMNSLSHYNLVHKFIPMLQAMKIPDAEAAVEKEWEKLEKMPAWQLTKVRNKNEVIAEARNEGKKVHFASLMDVCHLKNSELEPQHQKYRGRVVLRGDIVEDDLGPYAVFTEQGSSALQMTAATVRCHSKAARMRRTSSRRSISSHPSQNERCTDVFESSKVRMSRYLDTSTTTQVAKIMVQYGRSSRSS